MRILIDARITTIGGPSTYTNALTRAILKRDCKNNIYFVLYNKGQKLIFSNKAKSLFTQNTNPIYWIYWDNFVLPNLIRKYKIDLYHSLKRPEIMRIRSKKIFTVHAAHPFLHPELQTLGERLYWRQRIRKSALCADAVLTVSETDRLNLIKALCLSSEKVFAHPLALDEKYRDVENLRKMKGQANKFGLPEKYILFIGTQFLYKNLPSMIEAFAKAKKDKGFEHKFVLAGKRGPATKDIIALVEKLGLKGEVIFKGVVDDVSPLYANANLFIFTTLYDAFGFPVLEAMAHSTPVIISSAGALPEVAGDAALKYDPTDITGIANGIKKLLYDKDLRKEMIRKGYDQVKNFSWERCAKETIAVYNAVYSKK